MFTMPIEQFEELVTDALDGIPEGLRANMENVAVMVDDLSSPGLLLGLYKGGPLPKPGNDYTASVPDRITIYLATICGSFRPPQEVGHLVRETVIHELGHHFGI